MNSSTDILIIGGGIVGACTASFLIDEGYSVTIVDRGNFTDNCSFGNAGMIVPSHFIPLASPGMISKGLLWMMDNKSPFYIKPKLDPLFFQWIWQFRKAATVSHVNECAPILKQMHFESREWYQGFADDNRIEWKEDGILMLCKSDAATEDEINTAYQAHALDIPAEILNEQEVRLKEPSLSSNISGGVWYPMDATLDPAKTIKNLYASLKQRGVIFYPEHEVERLIDHRQDGCEIVFKNKTIQKTKYVVVSTGSGNGHRLIRRLLLEPGKGYSFDVSSHQFIPAVASILHEARVAITPMGSFTRIAGTLELGNFSNKINQNRVKGIVQSLPEYYQSNIVYPDKIWHGLRPCTPDGMPYIGRCYDKSAILLATGHAMMGVSLAPATGRILRDIIKGKIARVPHHKMDPTRF